MKKMFHPDLIEPYYINEDGSIIIYNNERKTYAINGHRSGGYYVVSFHRDIKLYVHKLVAEAFVENPNPSKFKVVTHIDKNTKNNHYTNLKWITHNDVLNEYHTNNIKITNKDHPAILKRLRKGETLKSIAKDYNVTDMTICRLKKKYLKELS